jgi:hypothetical protein
MDFKYFSKFRKVRHRESPIKPKCSQNIPNIWTFSTLLSSLAGVTSYSPRYPGKAKLNLSQLYLSPLSGLTLKSFKLSPLVLADYLRNSSLWTQSAMITAKSIRHDELADLSK